MSLEGGRETALIWVQMLCLAASINDEGKLYIAEGVPYTADMLAGEFGTTAVAVGSALALFARLKMTVISEDGCLTVKNYAEYQDAEARSDIREYNRLAKQKERERKRKERVDSLSMTVNDTENTPLNNINKSEEKRIEKNKTEGRIECVREKEKDLPSASREDEARTDEGARTENSPIGMFNNVFLSAKELSMLKDSIPYDYQRLIDELSSAIASRGIEYKSHYATIVSWHMREKKERELADKGRNTRTYAKEKSPPKFFRDENYDPDEILRQAIERTYSDLDSDLY